MKDCFYKMKVRSLSIILLLLPLTLYAETISPGTARQKAIEWFSAHAGKSKSITGKQLLQKELPVNIDQTFCYTYNGEFVLIGGRESDPVIIGYGANGSTNIPANTLQAIEAIDKTLKSLEQLSPSVNNLKAYKPVPEKAVEPFVSLIRRQEAPFNKKCPIYKHSNGTYDSTIVGCVATAIEQVITYYQYPSQLLDTLYGWNTSHYHVDTIPKGTVIDFPNILDVYIPGEYSEAQANAVSDLSYYCGIASHMNWGAASSGANFSDAIEPLKKAFGYKYVRHVFSSEFNAENWHKLLYEELSHQRPIVFAGYTTTQAGHAFVVDGINEDGFYHVLWGYGGDYDGYFNLDIFNTYEDPREVTPNGQLFGCYCNQEVILLHPDNLEYAVDDTLIHANRLRVDSVKFMRQPDLNKFVTAKIYVRNVSDETLYSSYLLMTYDPEDKTREESADYITLAGCTLEPHSSECLTTYCSFSKSGKRVLAAFTDDSAFAFTDTIEVAYSKAPKVTVNILQPQPTCEQVTLKTIFTNTSENYWSGNQIIYCLYEGEYTSEYLGLQHYTVLNLPPRQTYTDSITFGHLKPETKYTMVVRNTWSDMHQIQFTTPAASGIAQPVVTPADSQEEYFNLNGIKLAGKPDRGIYIVKRPSGTIKILKK